MGPGCAATFMTMVIKVGTNMLMVCLYVVSVAVGKLD